MSSDIPIPLPPPRSGRVIREPHKDTLPGIPEVLDAPDVPWQAPDLSPQQIVARYVMRQERRRFFQRGFGRD